MYFRMTAPYNPQDDLSYALGAYKVYIERMIV